MQTFHVVKESEIQSSFRVQQIRDMFDLSEKKIREEWLAKFDLEAHNWNIGLIVGASGSGKTTLSKEIFKDYHYHTCFDWPDDKAFIDGFDKNLFIKDITAMLNSVGFSSPPSWLKPFSVLSNGQKFRAELARCLLGQKKEIVFDEFTSVVDRDVAKIGCVAVSKAIRRRDDISFVAVSCHYDIIDWLDPDWVYDVSKNTFTWRLLRQRPEIKLDVHETTAETWKLFKKHHYLDTNIHHSAKCFVCMYNDRPVGFTSFLHFPHPKVKNYKKEHRTVVLPDFQGVGIGNRLVECVASFVLSLGYRYCSVTSNVAMIYHRKKSVNWILKDHNRKNTQSKTSSIPVGGCGTSIKRYTASFEFIGTK